MKIPESLQDELRHLDARHAARAESVASLREVIRQDADCAELAASDFASRVLASWHRVHPPTADPQQLSLFPDLRAELQTSPGVIRNWLDFNRHDWETARNMLLARTSNYAARAASAAANEREAFMAAYDRVVPLLATADMTTADVADKLTGAA